MYLKFESFKRSKKPNSYLIAPEGLCRNSTPDQIASVLSLPATAAFESLIAYFKDQKGWINLEYDEENHRISVVAVTKLLRFKDDVDVRILSAEKEDACLVAIYSRSRVGYSDLGANQKRVEALLRQIATV